MSVQMQKLDTTSLVFKLLAQKLTIERYRNAERLGITFNTYSEIAETIRIEKSKQNSISLFYMCVNKIAEKNEFLKDKDYLEELINTNKLR